MTDCSNCKHHRIGKDTNDSLRTAAGFYVCVRDPCVALVMNTAALLTVETLGCQHFMEVGK